MRINKVILLFLLPGILLLQTCKKVEKEMLVSTGTVSNILITSAVISGKILDLGQGATQYGHCYSKTSNPTIADATKDHSSPGLGDFTSTLEGLDAGTKYYVKAYLSRGKDVVYGNEISFTTAAATLPTVTTIEIEATSITKNSAVSGGNITGEGGTPVTARGICWALATSPTIDNYKVQSGSGSGTYICTLTDLTPDKKYFVRAYATNMGGTAYGNELSFTTLPDVPVPPTVTTAAIASYTSNSAISGGEVTNEGSTSVTAKGVCYGLTSTPTIDKNNKTNDGTGLGSFVTNITGLDQGTKYYFRAYATNSVGTSYGTEYNFTTSAAIPLLSTVPITLITTITASSGGDITSTGGSTILAKGVCWAINANPTIDNFKTDNGTGSGTFTSSISGLTPGTTYYVRAFATNSAGTGYGDEHVFTTLCTAPAATTGASTVTGSTSTTLNGTINPNGFSTTASFEYGLTTGYGSAANASQDPVTGNINTFVSAVLTGLASNSLYHYRAKAVNCSPTTVYGDDMTFVSLVSLTTTPISNLATTSITTGGAIDAGGGLNITVRGICWSTSPNPTIDGNKTVEGSGAGTFISNLSGLSSGILYYVRAYATNSGGTAYGNELSFTTITTPTISYTSAVSSITAKTAVSGGNITSNGGSPVISSGICWNTSQGPTISNNKTTDGTASGEFSSNLSSLARSTTYYVRAYATNIAGTAYGDEVSFKTLPELPTVITLTPYYGCDTFSGGGQVTDDGGAPVTTRGLYFTTSMCGNYTTVNGSGTGTFSDNIWVCWPEQEIWVQAYAINSAGIAVGSIEYFATYSCTVADADGNNYDVTRINNKLWTVENLRTTKYNDGTDIPTTTGNTAWANLTTPAYCWYNNDAATYKSTFGALYNWFAVNTGKLCPTGWHVPSITEWIELSDYLGGDAVAGGKLKETGTTYWTTPNTGATNSSGFSARPGGIRSDVTGNFSGIGTAGYWWSGTLLGTAGAYNSILSSSSAAISRNGYFRVCGHSVRCIKN